MSTLEDGDSVSVLDTIATRYENDINDIAPSLLRVGAFNRYHARSLISKNTPSSPKAASPTANYSYDGGTYTYDSANWTAMALVNYNSDGLSQTVGTQMLAPWSVVGHPGSSPATATTMDISLTETLGMANAGSPEDGCAGILVLADTVCLSTAAGGGVPTSNVRLHACLQVRTASGWRYAPGSHRAWDLPQHDGEAQSGKVNINMSIRSLLTADMFDPEFAVTEIAMGVALSNGPLAMTAAQDGINVSLGPFSMSAIGFFAGEPLMPVANFPTLFTTGTVGSDTMKDFLVVPAASSPENTLEIINGRLDADNLTGTVQREHCQVGSSVKVERVSGSISLDYFLDLWGGSTNVFGSGKAQQVPGLGIRFYVPWAPAKVLVTWQFLWQGAIHSTDENSSMWTTILRFGRADGSPVPVGPTRQNLEENVSSGGTRDGGHDGASSLRHISGHWLAEPTEAGWHDANIVVVPLQDEVLATQVRFWCRNIVVTTLKAG